MGSAPATPTLTFPNFEVVPFVTPAKSTTEPPPTNEEVVPLFSATWLTTYNLPQAKLGRGRTRR
ncbi:hypothetical protein Q31b_21410 [Novipirellula aureliae]|uniref:Uncharacterized protein n=1 Tax=Novipirellula aureliae TaxID=2527966 RepID=A0A5C6E3P6_9BACT|nr:hypothetical protein Q31b_21410 [Novipirellula aureliae]